MLAAQIKKHYDRLLITVFALVMLVFAHAGLVDDIGKTYTDAGFKRALITFGIARGLNGVISVAQGTEIAVEPAGIGMIFAPGQILDPINDLVERFSWVVLASSTSLGIQGILLDVASWPWFTWLVSLIVMAALWALWCPAQFNVPIRRWIHRLAIVLLILRFSVPLIAICSEALYTGFLEPQYTESNRRLEQTARAIGEINKETLPKDGQSSLLEGARRAYRTAAGALNVEQNMQAFKQAAADVSEYAIDLIVVFVMQTILFPLLFLWLVIQILKKVLVMTPFL